MQWQKGHSIQSQSNQSRTRPISVGCSRVHIHVYTASRILYIVSAIIHKDAFRPEENGRTGSRPLGLSGLSRLANQGRDYDANRLPPCCRVAYNVGNTGLPAKMCHYSDEYLQHVPKTTSAERSAHFKVGEWLALIRKSLSYFRINMFVCCNIYRCRGRFERNNFWHDIITLCQNCVTFCARIVTAYEITRYD